MFNRDDKQTEVLLSLQGHALSKEENPSNLEQEKNVLAQNNTIRFYLFLKGKDDERVPLAHKSPLTELRFTLVSSDLPKPSAASGPVIIISISNSTVSHRLRDWIQ